MAGFLRRYCGGSIPARAGEPIGISSLGVWVRVYPRPCGGTTSNSHETQHHSGLSPPVRGNQLSDRGVLYPSGSIPARAGEPLSVLLKLSHLAVYPRPCGGTYC